MVVWGLGCGVNSVQGVGDSVDGREGPRLFSYRLRVNQLELGLGFRFACVILCEILCKFTEDDDSVNPL